jgi:hypothetical protein
MAFDEVHDKIGKHIGTIGILHSVQQLPVAFNQGIGVAFSFPPGLGKLPEAVFVEPHLNGAGRVVPVGDLFFITQSVELPFPGNAGAVARFFHKGTKCGLFQAQVTEKAIIPVVVQTGHDLHPGGSAKGLGYAAFKTNAPGSQFVQVGRLVGKTPVGAQAFKTHVVGHDQDDIGRGRRPLGGASLPKHRQGHQAQHPGKQVLFHGYMV